MTLITAYDKRTGREYRIPETSLDTPSGRLFTRTPPTPPAPAEDTPKAAPRAKRKADDEKENTHADAR